MPLAMLVEPRELLFDGAFNLRDLGGLPAAGGRKVRRCTVCGSGELTHLGPDGFEAGRRLGLAVVIDLRTTVEIERRGRLDWEALKVTYRHVSLVEAAVGESGAYPPDIPEDWLRRRYEEIVDTRAEQVARVLTPAELAGCDPSGRAVHSRPRQNRSRECAAFGLVGRARRDRHRLRAERGGGSGPD
jgi:protein-tyrosine phosphatase